MEIQLRLVGLHHTVTLDLAPRIIEMLSSFCNSKQRTVPPVDAVSVQESILLKVFDSKCDKESQPAQESFAFVYNTLIYYWIGYADITPTPSNSKVGKPNRYKVGFFQIPPEMFTEFVRLQQMHYKIPEKSE